MGVRYLGASATRAPARFTDWAVGAAPPDQQQLGVPGRIIDFQIGNMDTVDLGLAQPDHEVMISRLVGDVARAIGSFQPADAVFQTGGARNGELAGKGFPVTGIRLEGLAGFGEGVLNGR
ncbi:Uncharacterised protein [Mycobacterium tuberculosis]|uniref:Uncharacterized protein n=1 Tax=Mycobacterium tuberculosis TaxID=1773 RepID=A0A654TWU4_MYCTX|nr:Uncharacterised protein [Mycobacterium tuberculosis]